MPPIAVRLALRIIIKAFKAGELDLIHYPHDAWKSIEGEISAPTGFQDVLSLLSHWEDWPDASKIILAQQGAGTWHFIDQIFPDIASNITPKDITLLIARFACNNHTICDEELRPYGLGVYPLVAMSNHSCSPSCVQIFGKKGRIELR